MRPTEDKASAHPGSFSKVNVARSEGVSFLNQMTQVRPWLGHTKCSVQLWEHREYRHEAREGGRDSLFFKRMVISAAMVRVFHSTVE